MLSVVLCIEVSQMCSVSWIVREFSVSWVLQAVGSSADDLGDDEGSLPWGGELVDFLLLEPEHQVTFHK